MAPMRRVIAILLLIAGCAQESPRSTPPPPKPQTAESNFKIDLAPPAFATALLSDSPFGINTAFDPDTKDLDARIKAMQMAGIKWGRQDFTWRKIEKTPGQYDFAP